MKIVSWNCNGALRKKYHLLERSAADICVIQECEDPAQRADVAYRQWAGRYLWTGADRNRGLGVFVREGVLLQELSLGPEGLGLFLPCKANDITLLAVWTKKAASFEYIGQLYQWLQRYGAHLQTRYALVVGDYNSNTCWDKPRRVWNHSEVVRRLAALGLFSLYHTSAGEAQGGETAATFYMRRDLSKPYHIDYAFLSEALLHGASLEIGVPAEWLAHSDHMPLRITLRSMN